MYRLSFIFFFAYTIQAYKTDSYYRIILRAASFSTQNCSPTGHPIDASYEMTIREMCHNYFYNKAEECYKELEGSTRREKKMAQTLFNREFQHCYQYIIAQLQTAETTAQSLVQSYILSNMLYCSIDRASKNGTINFLRFQKWFSKQLNLNDNIQIIPWNINDDPDLTNILPYFEKHDKRCATFLESYLTHIPKDLSDRFYDESTIELLSRYNLNKSTKVFAQFLTSQNI